ncbi:hypothetical protein ACFL6C_04160 [Myxococcota bacterium]
MVQSVENHGAGMKVVHRRFGPLYSEHDRYVFGMTNTTGHGGCWIHELACDDPDCIMADLPAEPLEVDLTGARLGGPEEDLD